MILIIALILCISLSACLSGSETALFSLSSHKIKIYENSKNCRKILISSLISKPQELLVTIIIFNISVNILVQNLIATLFEGSRSLWITVALPLVLTLFLGEVIPKAIGFAKNEQIAYRVAPFLKMCEIITLPFRKALIQIVSFVSRILFFFLRKEEVISVDELQHALRSSHQLGVLSDEEAELVRGYLSLEDLVVKEKMRPREEVLYFDLEEPLTKLVHLFVDQEVSRVPVCRRGLDEIIGIMTSQIFFLHREKLQVSDDLVSIVERPFFIPETTPAKSLLRQFYARQEAFGIVVDEHGAVTGIISLEDLVEVVVGEIVDRRDDKGLYTRSGKNVLIASGKMEIVDIEKLLDISLPSEHHMATIGGYLTEKLGDIPKSGTKLVVDGTLFQVLAADSVRVRRVYIRKGEK